jgi:WD40 repeat protein
VADGDANPYARTAGWTRVAQDAAERKAGSSAPASTRPHFDPLFERASRRPERATTGVLVGGVVALLVAVLLIVFSAWDPPRTGSPVRPVGEPLLGHTDQANSVAFSPDGRLLASGSDDGTVRLWDVHRHRALGRPFRIAGRPYVKGVAFSPDGQLLAATADDDTVRLWDLRTRRLVGRAYGVGFLGVAFSPDGKLLAAGGGTRTPGFDVCTGNEILLQRVRRRPFGWNRIGAADGNAGDCIESVAFSPSGRILAAGSDDGSIRLWDPRLPRRPGWTLQTGGANSGEVWSVTFSPDGRLVAAGYAGENNGYVLLWNPRTHTHVGKALPDPSASDRGVHSVVFSPDGHVLAAGSYADTIQLWNVRSQEELA